MGSGARGKALCSGRGRAAFVLVASATVCCAQRPTELPPVGEVLLVVDTDMAVPGFVSRLRIDIFAADGTWYESRDLSRAKLTDWPASFGLYLADPLKAQTSLVRLRAYRDGEVRDYRGERYGGRSSTGLPFETALVPAATDQPRLLREDGSDATPRSEPAPLLTIDRLVRVRVEPDVRAAVRVVLRGACVGTMADLANARSCIDTENALVAVADEPITPNDMLATASAVGSFARSAPCTATPRPPGSAADGSPLHDDEVCVDGTTFVFGSTLGFGLAEINDVPKRVAILPPFRIDRYEVTVGRWREALAHGFRSPTEAPLVNEGPLPTESSAPNDARICTWSNIPRAREDYPLTCLDWTSARSFCRWLGGDLPTEAQWEYVAVNAGRPAPTAFPWGGDPNTAATCDRVVIGRGPFPSDNECNPDAKHFGPLPVSAKAFLGGDTSLGLGVVDLTGNVTEYVRDAFASFTSKCWASQPLLSPACIVDDAPTHATRGGNWLNSPKVVFGAFRNSAATQGADPQVGFRCARPGT